MATYKTKAKKQKLAKANTQTKWAPFWTVPKKYGTGRKVHPGRLTTVKRSWRKTKLNV